MLAVSGTTGAFVGALQEPFLAAAPAGDRPLRWSVPRARASQPSTPGRSASARSSTADLPCEDSRASLAKSIAYGVGMAAALSAFGEVERQFADRVSRVVASRMPGNAALWRPVAHAAAFAGLAAGARVLP